MPSTPASSSPWLAPEVFAAALSAPHADPPAEVLLIEDDGLNRQLVSELLALRACGRLRLTQAPDLRAGLARLRERSYDLVLLDTKLPEGSALHALRAVSALAQDPNCSPRRLPQPAGALGGCSSRVL
jgi:CheY-like chemotaxis protein